MMKTTEYKIKLVSPAFLGNAEQRGQWRTPPFKALLRQWWRIVVAPKFNDELSEIRAREGALFGQVGNGSTTNNRANRSLVRIRFAEDQLWSNGTQNGVHPLQTSLDYSYAWFALANSRGRSDRVGIKAETSESSHVLHLAYPEEHYQDFDRVMHFIGHFGQIGSRCRGGWGSIDVDPLNPLLISEIESYAQPIQNCLARDWPACFARNEHGLLIWKSSATSKDWSEAMKKVAFLRRSVRTSLKSINGVDHRRVLGFADPGGRMPSPLRWRLYPEKEGIAFRIFAMPYQPDTACGFRLTAKQQEHAWNLIADLLSNDRTLQTFSTADLRSRHGA